MAVRGDVPRPTFAIPERIHAADEVIADWAHRRLTALGPTLGERHAVRALSPGEKTDHPRRLPPSAPGRCIGAMGSRHTMLRRRDRLRELQLGDGDIDTAENLAAIEARDGDWLATSSRSTAPRPEAILRSRTRVRI